MVNVHQYQSHPDSASLKDMKSLKMMAFNQEMIEGQNQ